MNWDAIGAIGEVGGAIAVVATLGYLASQLRQNTRAMHSATTQQVTTTASLNLINTAFRPEFSALLARVSGPGPWDLTDGERMQLMMYWRGHFRSFENQFYQHRQGFLEDQWKGYERNIEGLLQAEFIRTWWAGARETFGPEFRAFADEKVAGLEEGADRIHQFTAGDR